MSSAAPLDGMRVLDFTIMMAGPYCTRLMADLGAEVIKIEAPEGDHIRKRPPLREGRSTYFAQLNCGKKSLSIDLRRPEARDIVFGLVHRCDVLVENFRPGVMRRLGFDYQTLAEVNPRLVYCSISGFGQSGPWAGRSAYAPIVHACSGFDLANLAYQDGLERPLNSGLFIADVLGGALAFGAIQSALLWRDRTGKGDWIDLSLLDAMLGLQVYECQEAQFGADRRRPLYQPLRTQDGFIIVAPVSQANFEDLADAIGRSEWKQDGRFSTVTAREQNWTLLMSLLEAWTCERSAQACEELLHAAGVPSARYVTTREAMQHPHLVERGTFTAIDDGAGSFQVANPPFKLARGEAHARGHVAGLGADGRSMLADMLGYTSAAISNLVEQGVVFEQN